jgi:hypothetical protein
MNNKGAKKNCDSGNTSAKEETLKTLVFDKLDKIKGMERLVPQLAGEENPPEWVLKVGLQLAKVYIPGVKLTKETVRSPFVMGAVLGHTMTMAKQMTPARITMLKELAQNVNFKKLASKEEFGAKNADLSLFEDCVPPVMLIAKEVLAESVNLPPEQAAELMRGMEAGIKNASVESFKAHTEFTTRVYLVLWIGWQEVQKLKSVTELRKWLLERLSEIDVGSESRVKKLCLRIGLRFRGRGRPGKFGK